MFEKGDKVIHKKYGVGTVIKSALLITSVAFSDCQKSVLNSSLEAYVEPVKSEEVKEELDVKTAVEEKVEVNAEAKEPEPKVENKKNEDYINQALSEMLVKPAKKESEPTKVERKLKEVPTLQVYTDIARETLKAINQNKWLKIKYKNQQGEETLFMVGIKDINYYKQSFIVDSFNIQYSTAVSERTIYYKSIESAEVVDGTFHKTPKKLIDNMAKNPELYSFIDADMVNEDVLDYYSECFKLDNVPYKTDYGLIRSLDNDTLMENDTYALSEEQFKELTLSLYSKNDKLKKKEGKLNDLKLVMNRLSIKTKRGLYVLAYRELELDIEKKVLVPSQDTVINTEFAFDSDTSDAKNVMSITRFLPEESKYLLDDFDKNEKEIHKTIIEYNDLGNKSYTNILDSKPYIINLCMNLTVDIDAQFAGIKKMIANPSEMSMPIKTFFGNPDPKGLRRMTYPIYVVDDKYNIDQINAINVAVKSSASYIQGPPGTGKTQTLLNLIFTVMYNNKTALVTSNNNVPMDGVYDDILKVEYKPGVPLLFPAIRLGNTDNVNAAIDRIKKMAETAKNLTAKEEAITNLKAERKSAMKSLTDLLTDYEVQSDLMARKYNLENLIEKTQDESLKINLSGQLDGVNKELEDLGEIKVDDEKLRSLLNIDFRQFFMSIHFDTVSRLKRLNYKKYSKLKEIIDMPSSDSKQIQSRVKKFKDYLSDSVNLKDFQEIFPIIISTNLSATYLGEPKPQFDYVMMDEAGQCNVANALIPIVRAERLVLVGDPQQLRPVVVLDPNANKKLMKKYGIPREYDYVTNSIYTSFTNIDIVNNETLLSYHYRCNNKIIEFSNKKYYNNKLKLKSKSEENRPLVLMDTSKDDLLSQDNDKNMSDVEAKMIVDYIKKHKEEEIGVITPFVHQKECIDYYLKESGIDNVPVGTVHAFQGDQKKIIMFSTAITKKTHKKTYEWLKNNKELINVAISRPKDKLILLGSYDSVKNLTDGNDDMKELFDYVKTEGECEVTNVSPKSKALGTREISTESEEDFRETLDHLISVLNNNCYVKGEVSPASIFNDEKNLSPWFYNQRFDFVVFQRGYKNDSIIAIIELNGPEHSSREDVIMRDNYKKKLCEEHNIKLYSIPRECARDYFIVKDTLMESLTK